MPAAASLARVRGWGEGLKTTLLTIGGTFQKLDTLGASRVWITVLPGGELIWVSPSDEGTNDRGVGLISSTSVARRTEPSDLEIELVGDAPVWLQAESPNTEVSVIHFFDEDDVDLGHEPDDGLPMRIRGWSEETTLTSFAVSTTFAKVDTLGAARILIVPRTPAIFVYAAPTDEAAVAAGIKCMRDNGNDIRTVPYCLEVELTGAPLWLRGSSSGDCTLIHLYE